MCHHLCDPKSNWLETSKYVSTHNKEIGVKEKMSKLWVITQQRIIMDWITSGFCRTFKPGEYLLTKIIQSIKIALQSTRFTHERSTSNIHWLVHSSISFFKKFSDSLKLGLYIRNTILVIRNFFCYIVIINNSNFPNRTEKLVFLTQFSGMSRVIFLLFSSRRKKWREHKADKNNP